MASQKTKIKYCAMEDDEKLMLDILNSGVDPNMEGGWPIRIAARHGSYRVTKLLIQFGANPNLLGESGASTLQLAVYSGKHWDSDVWNFLLSFCDSSQLADGAAVAIIFRNVAALRKIMESGRCNTNIATTLTGKTLEALAKGYKLHNLLDSDAAREHPTLGFSQTVTETSSPRIVAHTMTNSSSPTVSSVPLLHSTATSSNKLSPSVARFFHQTASQTALSPTRSVVSPRNNNLY